MLDKSVQFLNNRQHLLAESGLFYSTVFNLRFAKSKSIEIRATYSNIPSTLRIPVLH